MNFGQMLIQMPPQMLEFHWKMLDKMYGMFFNGHTLNEIYAGGPIEDKDLLTPEQERDIILGEQGVTAQRGQDHMAHLEYLEGEFQSMVHALSPMQFELFKKLIMSHYQLMMQEVQEQQQQLMLQQAMQQPQEQTGAQPGQGKGHGGDRRNANSSQHTQTSAPSTASLGRQTGE